MTLNSALRGSRSHFSRLNAWAAGRRSEIRLALRVTAAALATFALVHLIGMPQGYWAVFTTVLIMQTSLGGSLQAITDRMIGTLGGASLGTVAAAFVPHGSVALSGLALAATLAPLTLIAALNPRFRVAPITAVIVLIGTGAIQQSPLEAGFFRMLAVALGSLVGLVVSLGLLPAKAHALMCQIAAAMLMDFAALMTALMSGLLGPTNKEAIGELHDQIRRTLLKLETAADEAQRERKAYLSDEPDPDPIPRTLRRLRHDLVMIGRTATVPLPDGAARAVSSSVQQLSKSIAEYLRGSAQALVSRGPPPDFAIADEALALYMVETAALHSAALLPREIDERLSALGFALDQLRRDCKDLAARIGEFAKKEIKTQTTVSA